MRLSPVLACIVAACGHELAAPEGGGSAYVNAVVLDSVTRGRLGGVAVAAGGAISVSSGAGTLAFPVLPGPDTVRISAAGYEPFVEVLPAGATYVWSDTVRLALRRIGPIAVRCGLTPYGFHASIVDLRGRIPLDQLSLSTLVLIDSTSFHEIPGTDWQLQSPDNAEWFVTIPNAARSTTFAFWSLRDSTGTVHQRHCEPDGFQ